MVEINIKIEKKHLFFITFVFIALAGLVFVFAQTTPPTPNPGHFVGDVAGAAPNCLTNPNHINCQAASSQNWGLGDVAIYSGYSAYSVNSGNANALGGVSSANYCLKSGAGGPNCGLISPAFLIPNGVPFKQPASEYCINSAFLCGIGNSVYGLTTNSYSNGYWRNQNNYICDWVLCSRINYAIP